MIQQLLTKEFDLIVVGGGITAAGILLDAQTRGINSILFEMQDFASGTSSRSTKLIHGGLRYLKQLEFSLVAEVGKERKIVYQNGMHITRPETMILPILKGGSINKIGAWFGLWLYDYLAKVAPHEKRIMLNKSETLELEPLLHENSLLGGVKYYEYRTDDARLTIELIKAAISHGANALNYFKVVGFIYDEDKKIRGVKVEDLETHQIYEVKSKHVVNASGPWVDHIDQLENKKLKNKIIHTKGVHIVVDITKLPIKNSLYFDAMDGRMIFAIPRESKVYIGTTDTQYQGNLEHPLITQEDRIYLLQAINQQFKQVHLVEKDIESGWAGLRPLVKQKNNNNPTAISRKDEIFFLESGLVTIAGGKLTGYRKMAERTVDSIASRLSAKGSIIKPCQTAIVKISGGEFDNEDEFQNFLKSKTNLGVELGISPKEASLLVYRYGKNISTIYGIHHRNTPEELQKWKFPSILLAEIKYALEYEQVLTPSDFFIRRTSALYFDIDKVKKWKNTTNDFFGNYFGWSNATLEKNLSELELQIAEAFAEY
ncbi:MAG: glycerol-3-phosphate dehydrogenase/oxidase [Cytophagales bacterium]|nr:MAG: glycerol-3-phosphate dehydrogenase/oxidase [Cytophagales bacterium]